ncbi:MAG: SGNH/GDSL hydrolase family protein [Verrucomicrobiota bacterium]
MKSLARFAVCALLFGWFVSPAPAAFTSLYVFGDGVCSTSFVPSSSLAPYYYGHRECNGRVWVEVLAQWQGMAFDTNKNLSFFGHYSPVLVSNVNNFVPPPDANTALFVVWANNADFVYDVQNYNPYTTNNLAVWTNAMNRSLSNHIVVVTNLYAKGARTLVMPNAVDISKTPTYFGLTAANKSFIRQRIIDFNAAFTIALSNTTTSLPALNIYVPDTFSLLDDVLAHPKSYGFTNTTSDAIDDGYTSFTGAGTNYVFWDYLHPTAKFQMILADITQQLLSPVLISQITSLPDSVRLEAVNIPIGRNGFVMGSTNYANWTTDQSFNSTNLTQSIVIPANGPFYCYRLRFPFVWTWP